MKRLNLIFMLLVVFASNSCMIDHYDNKLKISNNSDKPIGSLISTDLTIKDIIELIRNDGFCDLLIQSKQKLGFGITGNWEKDIGRMDGEYLYLFDYTLYKGYKYGNIDSANIEKGILMKFRLSKSALDSCNWEISYP